MTGSDPMDVVSVPARSTTWSHSSGVSIGAGVLSIVVGVLVMFWPGATVVVIAWLFAVQLIVSGILQIVAAFGDDSGTGGRVLLGLLGALSILVGLLCLRAPLQTAVILGLLIGATWVIGGVIRIVYSFGAGAGSHRGWGIASGVLSVLGGAVVLVYPGFSFVAMTWFLGIVLVLIGVVLVAEGFMTRRADTGPLARAGDQPGSAAASST
jgi:uncharacterized membrane protein HdeD (DUF308 family)